MVSRTVKQFGKGNLVGGVMSGALGSAKKRDANFELLRIIAMFMIITLHYNLYSNSMLVLGSPATRVQLFATFLEGFALTGLNVYVLLSGYFLSDSNVKPSRLLGLIAQVRHHHGLCLAIEFEREVAILMTVGAFASLTTQGDDGEVGLLCLHVDDGKADGHLRQEWSAPAPAAS